MIWQSKILERGVGELNKQQGQGKVQGQLNFQGKY